MHAYSFHEVYTTLKDYCHKSRAGWVTVFYIAKGFVPLTQNAWLTLVGHLAITPIYYRRLAKQTHREAVSHWLLFCATTKLILEWSLCFKCMMVCAQQSKGIGLLQQLWPWPLLPKTSWVVIVTVIMIKSTGNCPCFTAYMDDVL